MVTALELSTPVQNDLQMPHWSHPTTWGRSNKHTVVAYTEAWTCAEVAARLSLRCLQSSAGVGRIDRAKMIDINRPKFI